MMRATRTARFLPSPSPEFRKFSILHFRVETGGCGAFTVYCTGLPLTQCITRTASFNRCQLLLVHTLLHFSSLLSLYIAVNMKFRPCIDLHHGQVKQIVGSTLCDDDNSPFINFSTNRPASDFAKMYQKDKLTGGHVIMLGSGNIDAVCTVDVLLLCCAVYFTLSLYIYIVYSNIYFHICWFSLFVPHYSIKIYRQNPR